VSPTKKMLVESNPRPPVAQNERRERLRQQRAELSRTHILDAAEDATIRQIAKVAGFSPAAVYSFVDSKEDLVSAILDRHARALMELHADVLARNDRTPQQLDAIVDIQVDYHLAHPNFGRLFQHTIGLSFLAIESAMDETSRVRLGEQLELLEALFTRGIAEGDLHAGDPNTLATLFSSLMQGYLFRMTSCAGPSYGRPDHEPREAWSDSPPRPSTPLADASGWRYRSVSPVNTRVKRGPPWRNYVTPRARVRSMRAKS
jgi:AcrR family transcriptional regulator